MVPRPANTGCGRRASLALALVFALVGIAASPAAAGEVRETSERTFSLKPGSLVRIENQNGRITVEAWKRSEARVQITRVIRGKNDSEARSLIPELRVDATVKPSGLELKSRVPRKKGATGLWDLLGRRIASYQVHYYVQVPVGTALELETSNGGIRTRGTDADVTARTVNGSVDLTATDGETVAQTTNGSVSLSGVSGSARAVSMNGDVTAELRSVGRRDAVRCETTNGSVRLYVPRRAALTLEAQATNGRVDVRLPLQTTGYATSKILRGTLNGGGADVTARSTNGNVSVRPQRGGGRP